MQKKLFELFEGMAELNDAVYCGISFRVILPLLDKTILPYYLHVIIYNNIIMRLIIIKLAKDLPYIL